VATKYQVKLHPKVLNDDIPNLPEDLQVDFNEIFKPILQLDPHKCDGLPCHTLTGKLKNWQALEVEWEGDPNAYRLVYRIFEKPAPKHVEIVSFALHDPAYDKAKVRLGKK
jgi:mRNA interferase RelE/StbE